MIIPTLVSVSNYPTIRPIATLWLHLPLSPHLYYMYLLIHSSIHMHTGISPLLYSPHSLHILTHFVHWTNLGVFKIIATDCQTVGTSHYIYIGMYYVLYN